MENNKNTQRWDMPDFSDGQSQDSETNAKILIVEEEDDPEDEGKMEVLKRSSSTTTLESVDVTCSTELAAASSSGEGNFMTESELKRLSCDVEEFSESDKMEIQTINSSKKIEVIHETIVTEIKRTGNDLNCLRTGVVPGVVLSVVSKGGVVGLVTEV